MNRRIRLAALVIGLGVLSGPIAVAQQAVDPQPFVRATLEPAQVSVGQRAVLSLEVLVPNFFAAPPSVPDFQLRNAITRPLDRINLSEQHDGVSFAGIRYTFGLYPLEPGHYEIANATASVSYADVPPAHRQATLAIPRLSLDAFIPEGARALSPFLAATQLIIRQTIRQTIRQSSPELKVGDSVVRTIVVEAEGTPSMLLSPVNFIARDGLAVYPDQPILSDQADPRSDALTGTRTDQATYMLERAGDYVLPAIDMTWWRFSDNSLQHAHVEPLSLHVAENPALQAAARTDAVHRWDWRRWLDWILEHWLMILLAACVAVAVAWVARPVFRKLAAWYGLLQQAYRRSEWRAYARLRTAAWRGHAGNTYNALLVWLDHIEPAAASRSIGALKAAAQDPLLDRELSRLESHLFAARPEPAAWSPHRLMRRLAVARRRLKTRRPVVGETNVLPALNPQAGGGPGSRRRAVAR